MPSVSAQDEGTPRPAESAESAEPAEPSEPAEPAEPAEGDAPTVRLTRAAIRQARTASTTPAAVSPAAAPVPLVPAPLVVVVMAGLATLVGLSALAGPGAACLAVGFCAVVLAWGWALLVEAPVPRTATAVVGAGVVAITATAGLTQTEPYLTWVPVALAVSVMVAFLREVFRPHGRPHLTHGMAGSVGALAVTTSGATMVALPHYPRGGPWVLLGMAAVALAALAQLLARFDVMRRWLLLVVVVLGVGGALVVAAGAGGVPLLGAAAVGALVAVIAHSMLRILLVLPTARGTQALASAASASVLVVGVLVYVVARFYAG